MFLFPVIYILAFIYAINQLIRKEIMGLMIFIIIGLPIYINVLSVTYMYQMGKLIPLLQSFKEICVFLAFYMVVSNLKVKPRFHLIDKLVAIFFFCSLTYAILPIGPYDLFHRLLAFKVMSIFPVIYYTGRLCKASSININTVFTYICTVMIIAAIVVLFEVGFYQHIHNYTGFTNYLTEYLNGEASGSYGLIWTFETESGLKRFGSIFSSPLELSSATILAVAALLALATNKRNGIDITNFNLIALAATLICIVLAISRAAFANYFLLILCYAYITRQRKLIVYLQFFFITTALFIVFFLKGDLYNFIMSTIRFENASSVGHVVEWLNGIDAMVSHPLGLGLGSSGRVSMESKDHIGGENQLIITGVQVGIPMLIVYTTIYIHLITTGIKALRTATGKKKKLILFVVLVKIGIILPLLTSYIESFIYLIYTSHFLSGLMMNMIMNDSAQLAVKTNTSFSNISSPDNDNRYSQC